MSREWGDFTTDKDELEHRLTDKNVTFELDGDSWTVDYSDQDYKSLKDCKSAPGSDFNTNLKDS